MTVAGLDADAFVVRPYAEGDENDLVALFQSAYGRSITVEHWKWKLKPQRCTVDNVWVAVSNGRPVFQYAGIPTRFWLAQQPATVMVSVDTMTAPDFRRKGLLTEVGGQVYATWKARGLAFVIGLPNERWGSRKQALGLHTLFPLQWMARPLRPEAILAHRSNISVLRRARFVGWIWNGLLRARLRADPRIAMRKMVEADASFDAIWESCKAGWTFSAVRDRQWVEWRFLRSPSRDYTLTLAERDGRPLGYCAHTVVERQGRTTAYLADLFTERDDRATQIALLGHVVRTLLAANVDSLLALAIPGSSIYELLRRCGFVPRQAFTVQVFPLNMAGLESLMTNPESWNLSGADFDVV